MGKYFIKLIKIMKKILKFLKIHYFVDKLSKIRFLRKFILLINPWEQTYQNIIILKDEKLAFFLVQKVANSSIKQAFINYLDNKNIIIKLDNKNSNDFQNYQKVAIVRNPFDRLVSLYKQKIKSKHLNDRKHINWISPLLYRYNTIFKTKFFSEMSFEDFVKVICSIPDKKSDRHFRSQYALLVDDEWTVLPNHIWYFENIDNDFKTIMKKIGCDDIELLKVNITSTQKWVKNKTKNYKDFYTKELADMVYERYKKDCKLWYPNAHKELIIYLDNNKKND